MRPPQTARRPLPLPAFAVLVEHARANPEVITSYPDDLEAPEMTRLACLDQHAPAIETLYSLADIATWTGIRPETIRRDTWRANRDGSPRFPAPGARFGRSPAWTPRAVVEHAASRPARARRAPAAPAES